MTIAVDLGRKATKQTKIECHPLKIFFVYANRVTLMKCPIIQSRHLGVMRGSRKFCQRGSNFDTFLFCIFSLMRGGRIQISLLTGHEWPTSEMPFKWHFAGGPLMAQH